MADRSRGESQGPLGAEGLSSLNCPAEAAEPMTTRAMLVTRALDKDDQKLLALMTKRVGVTLRLQRVNGIVRSASGPGQYMIWEVER
jgi:hypothetical protein